MTCNCARLLFKFYKKLKCKFPKISIIILGLLMNYVDFFYIFCIKFVMIISSI